MGNRMGHGTQGVAAFVSGAEGTRQRAEFARALFPDLAAELDLALAESAVRRGEPSPDLFDANLSDRVDSFRERHAALAWHDLSDAAAKDAVLRSFAAARAALEGSGVELPSAESFVGLVDLDLLAPRFESAHNLVLVPAPYGLGLNGWHSLFNAAAARHPELFDAAEPLIVANEAIREFSLLDQPAPGVASISGTGGEGVRWTLRLVPAGEAPPLLGLNFEHGPHVSFPEMLMLQLMGAAEGVAPLDQASFTWLAGGLAEGKLAARHVYDAADRAVRVSCREIGNQGPHLGARAPVDVS